MSWQPVELVMAPDPMTGQGARRRDGEAKCIREGAHGRHDLLGAMD